MEEVLEDRALRYLDKAAEAVSAGHEETARMWLETVDRVIALLVAIRP